MFIAIVVREELIPPQVVAIVDGENEEIKIWETLEEVEAAMEDHLLFNHYDGRIIDLDAV